MKVMIVNKYWYGRGGADVYALWLADELKKRGHEVCVFSVEWDRNVEFDGPAVFISSVETEKMSLWAAPRTIGRMFWSFEARRRLREFLIEEKPDVAHIHNIYTQMSPSILGVFKDFGVPTVMTVHDYGVISANYSLFDDRGIDAIGSFWTVVRRRGVKHSYIASVIAGVVFATHRFFRVYEKGVGRMIFTTDYVRKLFLAHGWRGDRGVVIPYVVDLDDVEDVSEVQCSGDIAMPGGGLITDYGLASPGFFCGGVAGAPEGSRRAGDDDGYFFFAGRLHKTKGVEVLIEAARVSGLRVLIAGDGPDMGALRRQAGAMTNVEFLGSLPRAEVLGLMRGARAVVVPSIWLEPFGLVALEPQGLGTAVIASRIGGLSEVIVDGQTGFYVEPGDVDELAGAMRRLAGDAELAARMGVMGKRRVAAVYCVDIHIERLINIYEEERSRIAL